MSTVPRVNLGEGTSTMHGVSRRYTTGRVLVPEHGSQLLDRRLEQGSGDQVVWGGGGDSSAQVQAAYQQLLGRNPSEFEVQMGVYSIRTGGYQGMVEELQRKHGLAQGPTATSQQPGPYQQPSPYSQPLPYQQPGLYQQPQPSGDQGGTPLPMGPLPRF